MGSKKRLGAIVLVVVLFVLGCNEKVTKTKARENVSGVKSNEVHIIVNKPDTAEIPEGMVWISGGYFMQGAVPLDKMAMNHEKPRHKVAIDGFFMDTHEVTNAQFSAFVKATGYLTLAERKVDWEELKKQLPENTAKPHDSILQPGSLVFKKTAVDNLHDYSQWWSWKIGANWKHPYGPESSIKGKENHPVVHIAYEDALAYCAWKGTILPTETQWEYAARANVSDSIYFWGNDIEHLFDKANTWTGEFPLKNNTVDGYERTAPVGSYPPNDFGLYDMAGNVWEWTNDWYNTNHYKQRLLLNETSIDPRGASTPYNSTNPYTKEKVIKGGSFLCSASYCAGYRISSRMGTTLDSGLEHLGFRTIKELKKQP